LSSLELPRFALAIRPDRSRVVLALTGEIDVASVADVQTALQDLRDAGWEDIVVDLRDVSFIDSTGLGVLIAADERARREGWELAVTKGSPPLERLLKLACLSSSLRRV
jgi:anti-sigma B factor antagonist